MPEPEDELQDEESSEDTTAPATSDGPLVQAFKNLQQGKERKRLREPINEDQIQPRLNTALSQEEDEQEAEDLVTVVVYDPDKDENVDKTVTRSEAVQILSERPDRGDMSLLDTSMYPQNRSYYWANMNPKYQEEVRRKGYAPVRKSPNGAHSVLNVPGMGQVVSAGDLVLFDAPREWTEKRKAREEVAQKRETEALLKGATANLEEIARDPDVRLRNRGLQTEYSTVYVNEDEEDFYGTIDEDDYASAAAASYEAVAGAGESFGASQPRSRSFAGFNGPMGRGIPESPALRR